MYASYKDRVYNFLLPIIERGSCGLSVFSSRTYSNRKLYSRFINRVVCRPSVSTVAQVPIAIDATAATVIISDRTTMPDDNLNLKKDAELNYCTIMRLEFIF